MKQEQTDAMRWRDTDTQSVVNRASNCYQAHKDLGKCWAGFFICFFKVIRKIRLTHVGLNISQELGKGELASKLWFQFKICDATWITPKYHGFTLVTVLPCTTGESGTLAKPLAQALDSTTLLTYLEMWNHSIRAVTCIKTENIEYPTTIYS